MANLSVKCGAALLLSRAEPRAQIIGVDPDREVLAVARHKAAACAAMQWRVGMGDALVDSVGADSVSTVMSSLVRHHVPISRNRCTAR
jgi:ubiquinone/menaquinone biosynthesis C-methylase UbiE